MNVMAMADGHDTINVSWEAPTDTGNSDITGYIIERRYAGDMMMDIRLTATTPPPVAPCSPSPTTWNGGRP